MFFTGVMMNCNHVTEVRDGFSSDGFWQLKQDGKKLALFAHFINQSIYSSDAYFFDELVVRSIKC